MSYEMCLACVYGNDYRHHSCGLPTDYEEGYAAAIEDAAKAVDDLGGGTEIFSTQWIARSIRAMLDSGTDPASGKPVK